MSRGKGFTLIELLVVVVIIGLLSGLLLPAVIAARDKARKAAEARNEPATSALAPKSAALPPAPEGLRPAIDSLALQMELAASYHRLGIDVYTRYTARCTGTIGFRHPGGGDGQPVLLAVPFPEEIVEARDVELQIAGIDGQARTRGPILYRRDGIFAAVELAPGETLEAAVKFTALGRERFEYRLPPAERLESVDLALNLQGAESFTVPDDALQPTASQSRALRWNFRNLVSDRRIVVNIPGAQSPIARVLLLLRLAAVAVLIFGAGFWFLSEQSRPGQLDRFRLGHFLLLALTYCLFFAIFTVLEFHGRLGTGRAMLVAALFSLPLLVLHVSRVLDGGFALTRVVPLALFSLALVINGVYGGEARDYVFIAGAVLAIGYATVAYPGWAAGRERHRQEKQASYARARLELIERVARDLGGLAAELRATDHQAAAMLKRTGGREELAADRARLVQAREGIAPALKEQEDLAKWAAALPSERSWEHGDVVGSYQRLAESLGERLQTRLTALGGELASFGRATDARVGLEGDDRHCAACGGPVGDTPFCPHCGAANASIAVCADCGERIVTPLHLVSVDDRGKPLHCTRCGAKLAGPAGEQAAE